jgi:ribose-phosphate pyrophosphokinase
MKGRVLFSFEGNAHIGQRIHELIAIENGKVLTRKFPDGESYVRMLSAVAGKEVYLLCSLSYPDDKVMTLYFFSQLARDAGAASVTLLAPYLGYMRQDKAFLPGEAITSNMFAALLSRWFDRLITIDPHLHRHKSMDEIYSIPTDVLHAKEHITQYIKTHVERPVIIGPDEESRQWAAQTAALVGCKSLVMKKERFGDREVRISVPGAMHFRDYTPVLVDDIISTGVTMSEAIKHLKSAGMMAPVCIGIHGVFASGAYDLLTASGASKVITTNTIEHPSNGIDISDLIAGAIEA